MSGQFAYLPFLKQSIDDMQEGLQIIDRQWRYVYVNGAAASQGRLTPADLVGRTMLECYPGIDKTDLFKEMDLVMQKRTPRLMQNPFEFPNGTKGWFELSIEPVAPGILIRSGDITARKLAEDSRQDAEPGIMESHKLARIGSWEWVEATNTMHWSDELCILFGIEPEDQRNGLELFQFFILDEDREKFREALEKARKSGEAIHLDHRIKRKDGAIRWMQAWIRMMTDESGKMTGVRGTNQDITERIKHDSRLMQSQKLEAIGLLSGGVAHDFNNLLTVIMGHTAVLEMSDLPASEKESSAEIKKAAERAGNLTRQLLLFARRQTMVMQQIELNDTIDQTMRMLNRIVGEDIEVKFRPSAAGRLQIQADPGMLDQVLMNLTVNARDAMPKGGSLIVETSTAVFDEETASQSPLVRAGSFAVLSVSDSGSGIPPDVMPKIFDPFFTTKDIGKGTGLGLSTVFGIVQQHGGWVSAYSQVGMGSTFRVHFPISSAKSEKHAETKMEAISGGRETILFVEDESAIRSMAEKFLTRLGYKVLCAENGKVALEIWHSRKKDIDLIFTDIVMPGEMTGFEMAAQILSENPAVSIVYTSGYSDMLAGDRISLEEGVNFLMKPYALMKVGAVVRLQLDKKRQ